MLGLVSLASLVFIAKVSNIFCKIIIFCLLYEIQKVIVGGVVAGYFKNAVLGSWWAGMFGIVQSLISTLWIYQYMYNFEVMV